MKGREIKNAEKINLKFQSPLPGGRMWVEGDFYTDH